MIKKYIVMISFLCCMGLGNVSADVSEEMASILVGSVGGALAVLSAGAFLLAQAVHFCRESNALVREELLQKCALLAKQGDVQRIKKMEQALMLYFKQKSFAAEEVERRLLDLHSFRKLIAAERAFFSWVCGTLFVAGLSAAMIGLKGLEVALLEKGKKKA